MLHPKKVGALPVAGNTEALKQTNEITMAIPLLDGVGDLTNTDVTADALLTQRTLATDLVGKRKAHDHFTVKGNQPTLFADLTLRFQMTDGDRAVPVSYRGVIPDTFGDKGEVVVEGVYRADGIFDASFLMAKCPSKYEMSPDEEAPAGMPVTSTKAETS